MTVSYRRHGDQLGEKDEKDNPTLFSRLYYHTAELSS